MSQKTAQHGALARGLAAFGVALALGLGLAPAGIAIAEENSMAPSETTAARLLEEDSLAPVAVEDPATEEPTEPAQGPTEPPAVETEEPAPATPARPAPVAPTAPVAPEGSGQPTTAPAETPESEAALQDSLDESVADADEEISPMAVGPDGATPPYVYWDVRDADTGELVSGATFAIEYRHRWLGWRDGNNASSIVDCNGTCSTNTSGNVLDRDTDGGEFLLEHFQTNRTDSNRIVEGNNYRVKGVEPPAGYEWVASPNWITIGGESSNNAAWNDAGGADTHGFGTFDVKKVQTAPVCTAGYVYALSGNGQLQQVSPNGTVSPLGTSATGVSVFNGLGIASGGSNIYAIERSSSSGTSANGTVYSYDVLTGVWTSTGKSTAALGGNTGTNLVAGAVDLSSGLYYFGGFTGSGDFKIYQYNPASNSLGFKGTVRTSATSNANGDMAFDSAGNLFIVRGLGNTTTVYSVTKANFTAASGGDIPSSQSATVSTMSDVNGVAFDAAGKAYLGSSGQIRSYNMPNWSGSTTVTSSGLSSTDLATCSSPPTITIEKFVENGRINSTDQFKLSLTQGSQTIGEATTTGVAVGPQSERVGPLPTVRGVPLTFSETAAGTTDLADYASSFRCEVDGVQDHSASGNGTSGTIIIPPGGQSVLCTFHNAPLVADVTIQKQVTDALGENPQPQEGWTVGATTIATEGSATQAPAASTQTTGSDGTARWEIDFGSYTDRANVKVSETQQDGFEFVSGMCVVTHLNGSTTVTDLTSADEQTLTGIEPGDNVDCTYVNKPKVGQLAIVKAFDDTVPASVDLEFEGTYSCTLDGSTVASGTWLSAGAGDAVLTPDAGTPAANVIPAGAECSAVETPPTGSTGLPNSSYEWGAPSVTGSGTIVPQEISTLTVTNTVDRVFGTFSVTKDVVGTADDDLEYSGGWQCVLTDELLDDEIVSGTWGPIADGETWMSSASDEIPLGAECSVVNEDGRPAAPVDGDPSYSWDGDPDLGSAVNASATPSEIIVTNTTKRELGSVTWTKVDATDNLLSGSEWALTGPSLFNGGATLTITDCTEAPCSGPDMDPAGGAFLLEDLPWGDYTLTETKAPAGYYLNNDDVTFTIGKEAPASLGVELGSIINSERESPELPLTGGIGRELYPLMGAGLLFLGLGGVGYAQLRKNRKEVAHVTS
ncbi:SpaA isopeptide-forming pilin-related protein [Flaviflexus huanghaiensis]|uniref:SpaA isopeptide-forming pilin-related protein n=1 Tax=Flaviflexus huanghaiensis TaxID=1111473 RepID=UPI0015FC37C3|nr:SpaA isopeptide-forming pilin-related protein [Flaviflexus huanghaiensis]